MIYVEDAKLYLVVENINDSLKIQQDLNKFSLWASIKGLSVDSSKCFFVSFARSPSQLGTSYSINNSQLEGVDCMRGLGVVFDTKMNFGNHIETVVNKCLRTLRFMRNVTSGLHPHREKNPAFHVRHLPNVSRSACAEGFTLVAVRAKLGCRRFEPRRPVF